MAEESTYIVQVEKTINAGSGQTAWVDIATVVVPPRTKRKTIFEKAFEENGSWRPEAGEGIRVRALDAESAASMPVVLEEQPPRLKIG